MIYAVYRDHPVAFYFFGRYRCGTGRHIAVLRIRRYRHDRQGGRKDADSRGNHTRPQKTCRGKARLVCRPQIWFEIISRPMLHMPEIHTALCLKYILLDSYRFFFRYMNTMAITEKTAW